MIILDDTFYDYFAQFGELVDWVVMKYPPDFERSRGFGFVTYKDVKMMEKCLKQNPHFIDDFQVEARRAVARENVGHDYDQDWDYAGEYLVHQSIKIVTHFTSFRSF